MPSAAHRLAILLLAVEPGLVSAQPILAVAHEVTADGGHPAAPALATVDPVTRVDDAAPPGVAGAPRGPAPATPAALATSPDLRARIYVGDLSQLATLVRRDPALAGRADELEGRRTGASVLGGAAAASLLVLPLLSFADVTCTDWGMGLRQCSPQPRLAIAGLLGAAILGGIALAVAPSRGDVLDLLSQWNLRHPDRQLDPDPWLGAAVGTAPPETVPPPPPSQ